MPFLPFFFFFFLVTFSLILQTRKPRLQECRWPTQDLTACMWWGWICLHLQAPYSSHYHPAAGTPLETMGKPEPSSSATLPSFIHLGIARCQAGLSQELERDWGLRWQPSLSDNHSGQNRCSPTFLEPVLCSGCPRCSSFSAHSAQKFRISEPLTSLVSLRYFLALSPPPWHKFQGRHTGLPPWLIQRGSRGTYFQPSTLPGGGTQQCTK